MSESDWMGDWIGDWGVIWRSELRAMAEDRELLEAEGLVRDAIRRARAASSAWAAAAAVPPDDGGPRAGIDRLARRVDELEQRLARLDEERQLSGRRA